VSKSRLLQGVFLVDFFASNSQMRFLVTAPWKKPQILG
jgi:hypothetical protein